MNTGSPLSWAWPLLGGAAGAALFGFVTHEVHGAKAEASPHAAEVERADQNQRGPEAPSVADERAAAFARAFATAAASAKPPAADPQPLAHPTEEDRRRQADTERRDHERLLSNRTAERRDPEWAREIEGRLDDSLRKLPSEVGARYEGGDCRSSTCAVTLSWASRAQAQAELQTDMSFVSIAGCTTRVTLGPEDEPEGRYSASFLMDCSASRTTRGADPAGRPL
jgi:hypothetical protein